MKREFHFGIGAVALIGAAAILGWLTQGKAVPKSGGLTVLGFSQLRLTLAWNGETMEAAARAALPPSILESVEYKRWLRVGDGTEFIGKDPKGNRVVATALAMVVDAKGTRRPLITSIKVFLPNGTLINETSYTAEGLPMLWIIYDTNATKIQRAVYRTDGLPGAPFIRQARFFSPDGTAREYRADNPERIVWGEWALDPEGSLKGKINGGREELVAKFIKQKELEPDGAVNRSQPIRSETNSTSWAAQLVPKRRS